VRDDQLRKVIAGGRAGTPMPAFAKSKGGPLTKEQVEVLVEGLKERWGPAQEPKGLPPYLSPRGGARASAAAVERGGEVFAMACAGCHGEEGKGGKGKVGAINDRAFLALISDQALRRIVITGRPDLGMPGYDDKKGRDTDFQPLTSKEIDDVVALLGSWRR